MYVLQPRSSRIVFKFSNSFCSFFNCFETNPLISKHWRLSETFPGSFSMDKRKLFLGSNKTKRVLGKTFIRNAKANEIPVIQSWRVPGNIPMEIQSAFTFLGNFTKHYCHWKPHQVASDGVKYCLCQTEDTSNCRELSNNWFRTQNDSQNFEKKKFDFPFLFDNL